MSAHGHVDRTIKLMILGESQIGKSCLIQRYVKNDFGVGYLTTVGIDFQIKYITIQDKNIKLQIWDTAGQERFKNISKNYFQASQGFIVAYDITSRESFNGVKTWVKEIDNHAPKGVKMILIGTKCDLEKREVCAEEGKEFADKRGIPFLETSAKNDINVATTFETLAKNIFNAEEPGPNERKSIVLSKDNNETNKKECC